MAFDQNKGIETGRSFAVAPFRIDTLQSYLAGYWLIKRDIHQVGEGQKVTLNGSASFVVDEKSPADTLIYNEEGLLETPEGKFDATRSYIYKFIGSALAEVRFSDGEFFHVLDLSAGPLRVEHHCGDDFYQGLFRAVDTNTWLSVWRIEGPRKKQVISTHYMRVNN
ncbi:MAG: DUF6314 family protein [Rhodospirillaceae bacterium]|nr:DUF6314 family protein [Rhodospirillaceae bacterium]